MNDILNNLPEWHDGQLTGSMKDKVRAYLKGDLILQSGDGIYTVLPLPRRHQIHTVRLVDGYLSCDCQGFHSHGTCSHVAAVRAYREMERRRENEY